MFTPLWQRLRSLGPGLILAAAGIGAGDVVVASVTGVKFGYALLWAIVFTAALKFVLTEALARWQLATSETITRAWVTRLPRWVSIYFAGYLLLWTFLVGASLSSACGLAGASLFPALSVPQWGVLHAVVAAVLVGAGRYAGFQRLMKGLIALMAGCVLACALLLRPPPGEVLTGVFVPSLPAGGGGAAVLALLGGIGGSVTVLGYAYLLRGQGWAGADKMGTVRADLRLAYVFTGLFGVALCVIASGVHPEAAGGTRIAVEVAARLETVTGPAGRWAFLVGFWCTVFAAMLGVWQCVPHIYVDLVAAWRRGHASAAPEPAPTLVTVRRDRAVYLGALAFMAGPPLVMLGQQSPVAVVMTFSIAGAFFMPFLAATLLYLTNRRDWMGALTTRRTGNIALVVCLVVFGIVCVREILEVVAKARA